MSGIIHLPDILAFDPSAAGPEFGIDLKNLMWMDEDGLEADFLFQSSNDRLVPQLPIDLLSDAFSAVDDAETHRRDMKGFLYEDAAPAEDRENADASRVDSELWFGDVMCDCRAAPKLQLDYAAVISAWEGYGSGTAVGTDYRACETLQLLVPPPALGLARSVLPSLSYSLGPGDASCDPILTSMQPGLMPDAADQLSMTGSCDNHIAGCYPGTAAAAFASALQTQFPLPPLPDSLASIPVKALGDTRSARAACVERCKQKKMTRHICKIRYEQRRLHAEKRPRIKGRFVKREELKAMLAAAAERELAKLPSSEPSNPGMLISGPYH